MAYDAAFSDGSILANPALFDLATRIPRKAQLCMASEAKAQSMAFAGMMLDLFGLMNVAADGQRLESGVYFATLAAAGQRLTLKVARVR